MSRFYANDARAFFIGPEKVYDHDNKFTLSVSSSQLVRTQVDYASNYTLFSVFSGVSTAEGAAVETLVKRVSAHVLVSGFTLLPSNMPQVFAYTQDGGLVGSQVDPSAGTGAFNTLHTIDYVPGFDFILGDGNPFMISLLGGYGGSGFGTFKFLGFSVVTSDRTLNNAIG
jgi:hypothetical protein